MDYKLLTSLLFWFFSLQSLLVAQFQHSVELIRTVNREDLAKELGEPVDNGVHFYKMTYHTTGSDGMPDIASGLIVIPDNDFVNFPLVIYHHGTSSAKSRVPSSLNLDYEAYAFFGGAGYVVLAPDYLGMGDSRGFHPYVHRATQASASVDMLKGFHEWALQSNVSLNGSLFLTGYSQGGHASMATHQLLEEQYMGTFDVTAAAHLAGPYSLSTVMKEVMIRESDYGFVGFIPFAILGFQTVYGDVFTELTDVFRPSFVAPIQSFYSGQISLTTLAIIIQLTLLQEYGNSFPINILNPVFADALQKDENNRINEILRMNDVYDWMPKAPTRLFFCQADELVPYQNALVAGAAMKRNSAPDVQLFDVSPSSGHSDCAGPALLAALEFFNDYRMTTLSAFEANPQILIFPNPTNGKFNVGGANFTPDCSVTVRDLTGRKILTQAATESINITGYASGVYMVVVDYQGARAVLKINKY
jgi:pimeloyl-ACP methyl ester carboxylesterase